MHTFSSTVIRFKTFDLLKGEHIIIRKKYIGIIMIK